MEMRVKFESSAIRDAHGEEYEELFENSSVLTSTSGSFYWSGEHLVLYGGPSLIQKLPVRVWLGLSPTSKPGIQFRDWKIYSPRHPTLQSGPFPSESSVPIKSLLEPDLHNFTDSAGLIVNTLFEFLPSSGLNSSGAMSAALSLGLFSMAGMLTQADVEHWKTRSISENLSEATFDKVFRLAWKLDVAISGGVSSGGGALAALVDASPPTYYPIIYWAERRYDDEDRKLMAKFPVETALNYELLDKIKIGAARIDELYKLPPGKAWPIDFGLIFSGKRKPTGHLVGGLVSTRRDGIHVNAASLNQFYNNGKERGHSPPIKAESYDEAYSSWWESALHLGSAMTARLADEFAKNMLYPTSQGAILPIIDLVNQYHNFLNMLDVRNEQLNNLRTAMQLYLEESLKTKVGIKTTGAGNGGDLLFVVPRGDQVDDSSLEEHLKERYGQNIKIDYLSWLDGYGGEGPRVHSNWDEGVFPRDWPKSGLCIMNVFGDGERIKRHEHISALVSQYDIGIVNLPGEQEIYFNGNSPEPGALATKRETIEAFTTLILSKEPFVPSQKFFGSYQALGEFQDKILKPVQNILRAKDKQQLDVTINPLGRISPPGRGKFFEIALNKSGVVSIVLFRALQENYS